MGSFRKHIRRALALLLTVALASSMSPVAAYALPSDGTSSIASRAAASPESAEAQTKVDAALEAPTASVNGAAEGEMETSVSVITYSSKIVAELLCVGPDPSNPKVLRYKASTLKNGLAGKPYTFQVRARGGHGLDSIGFKWSYAEVGAQQEDIDASYYLPNEEADGAVLGSLNITKMACDSKFQDNKQYEFYCTVSSNSEGSDYSYSQNLGPAKLETVNGFDYPNKTIYPEGDPTLATGDEDNPQYVRDERVASMATISGAIHRTAQMTQSEIAATDDAFVRFSLYLSQNLPSEGQMYVMGTPYIIQATSDGNVSGAVSDGPAETTLPKAWLPASADESKGVEVLFIGADGSVQKLDSTLVDNKYYLLNTGESGVYVLVGKANKTSVKKFTVDASITDSGVVAEDSTALIGGSIEPGTGITEYAMGSSATYRLYPDTKNGFDVGEVRVSVDGAQFVYKQGVVQGGNPQDHGITFGGNFVTFERDGSPCNYELSVKFEKVTSPNTPVKQTTVYAQVQDPKEGGTVSLDGAEYGQTANLSCVVGETVTLRMKPANNTWGIESVVVNGEARTPDGLLVTFKAKEIAGGNVVQVKFKKDAGTPAVATFEVSGQVSGNMEGSCITNDGLPQKVAKGDSATVAFRANDGSHIDYVQDIYTDVDGVKHTVRTQVADKANEYFPMEYSYSLENVTVDHTVKAYFATTYDPLPVNVYIDNAGTGTGDVFSDGEELVFVGGANTGMKMRTGDAKVFTFRADAGSRLASVKLNSRDITGSVTGGAYMLVSEGREYNIEVRFDKAQNSQDIEKPVENVKVVYDTNVPGSVTPDMDSLPKGASQTFGFSAPYPLKDARVTIDGVESDNLANAIVAAGGLYNIEDVSGDVLIKAIWDIDESKPNNMKEEASLKVNVEGPGWADPASTFVMKGSDASVFLYAEGNASLASVKVRSGATLKPAKVAANAWQVTLPKVDTDVVLDAVFTPGTDEKPVVSHTVSLVVQPEGAATLDKPLGANSVQDGHAFNFTITPVGDYKIKSISSTHNGDMFDINEYLQTISNVAEDRTITIVLTEDGSGVPSPDKPDAPKLVQVSTQIASGAGSIEPKSPEVKAGSNKTFYFTPAKNVESVKVKNAGASQLYTLTDEELSAVKCGEGYTLQNIQEGALVQASFVSGTTEKPEAKHKVTVTTPQNGSIVLRDVDNNRTLTASDLNNGIVEGTRIEVAAVPGSGYKLDSLKIGGNTYTVSPQTFTLMADTNISAVFSNATVTPDPSFPDPVDPLPAGPGGTTTNPDIQIELPENAPIKIPAEGYDPAKDTIKWFVSPDDVNWYELPIDGDAFPDNPYVGIVVNPDGSLDIPYPNSMELGNHSFKAVVTQKGTDGQKDPNAPQREQDYEVDKGGVGEKATLVIPGKSISVAAGTSVSVSSDVPGAPIWQPALPQSFTDAQVGKSFTYTATYEDAEKIYKQAVTITVRAKTEGGNNGNTETGEGSEIKVPAGTGGSGGSSTDVDIPSVKPDSGKTVAKSEWFVSADKADLFAHLISMSTTPEDYAAQNLEEGTYWFTNRITYTNGDAKVITTPVTVGKGGTPERPGAGIPSGSVDPTDPGTGSGDDVGIEEGGTGAVKPGIGNPGDNFEWWVKPSDGDDWTKLPSTEHPGMSVDPNTGELVLGPEVDPGDYNFEVIVAKPDGSTTKQEIDDVAIKNDNPFNAGENEVNNGTSPIRPTYPAASPEDERWSIKADGEDTWTDIEAPEGGTGAIGSADLNLAPGYYTIRVVTTDAKGKKHEEFFPIHVPQKDSNTAATYKPTGLVDVNVRVSVSVTATVNTTVSTSATSTTLNGTTQGVVSPSGTFQTHLGDTESFYIYPNEGYTADVAIVKEKSGGIRRVPLKGYDPASAVSVSEQGGFNLFSMFGLDKAFADDATLTPTYYECYTLDLLMEDAILRDGEIDIFIPFKKIEDADYTLIPAGETYDVQFSANNGLIYPKEDMRVPAGKSVSFLTFPSVKGANLKELTVGGKAVTPTAKENGTYVYKFAASSDMVTTQPQARSSRSVGVIPVAVSYGSLSYFEVTGAVTPAGAGSISPSKATVEAGGSQAFEIKANEGFTLSYINVGSKSYQAQEAEDGWTFTLTDVAAPTTVTAVFVRDLTVVPILHEVKASVEGGHGTVSPEVAYVKDGDSQSFVLKPDAGYQVVSVSVDEKEGAKYAGVSTFVLRDVKEDHSIVVKFQPAQTGGSAVDRTMRTLQSLAQTGDIQAPAILALMTIVCASLGIAVLISGRRKKESRR